MNKLHNANINVGWDPDNFKQVNEAKKAYLQARKEGRNVVDMDGKTIERFSPTLGFIMIKEPDLKAEELFMRIFDKTGDRRLIWNSTDPDQIKEAKALFDEYLAKGWKPYAITRGGGKGYRIYEWDLNKEELVIDDRSVEEKMKKFAETVKSEKKVEEDPRTIKQKLSAFVERFKEVKIMPRTFPG